MGVPGVVPTDGESLMGYASRGMGNHMEFRERLTGSEPPSMVVDTEHRILLWNRGAERLLGRKASEVIGRRCQDVLGGRDPFGNRACHTACSPCAMLRAGETVKPFEMTVTVPGGANCSLRISTTVVRREKWADLIVHTFEPVQGGAGVAAAEPPLTPRQRDVLRLIALGLQNKEIAAKLGLSLATVRNHVHAILDTLGLHSKLEAVALAFRSGWVEQPEVSGEAPELRPADTLSACTGSSGR
jgi:DNA-binding CsgD family transcriptional regulator